MVQLLRSLIGKNLKSWEDLLPFIEFAYNRAVHSTTHTSPFEVVYGFNPLTPLDLIPMPFNKFVSSEGDDKAAYIKELHANVKARIEKQNEKNASWKNKGRVKVQFQPGDWVWVHFRKERFPKQRKSKLMARGDGPFQVLERINDNAYKIDLPGEYNVSTTFNVADLTPFDVGDEFDLRTNLPKEEGNVVNDMAVPGGDEFGQNQDGLGMHQIDHKAKDDELGLPIGPITRSRARKLQVTMNGLIQEWIKKNEAMDLDLKQASNKRALFSYFEAQIMINQG